MPDKKSLTSFVERGNMGLGKQPAYLDNEISATPTVQAFREFTTENGCHVKVFFKKEQDPKIRKEIARLLLAAFEQERNVDDEASHVSVQSIDKRPG